MSVKWSSPTRQKGLKTLSPIPNEIYLEIFDHLDLVDDFYTETGYKRTLSNLALVCRLFCSLAIPRIFKQIVFMGPTYEQPVSTPSHVSFCREVIKNQEPAKSLALHTRDCSFCFWFCSPDDVTNWAEKELFQMHRSVLRRMVNVETLRLIYTPIDKRMLKTICGLKNLKSLTLTLCPVLDEQDSSTYISALSSLRLTTFDYSAAGSHQLSISLAQSIDLSEMKILRTGPWELSKRIIEHDGHLPLEVLDIFEVKEIACLPTILEKTPHLTNLRLCVVNDPNHLQFSLSKSSLPKLQVLECPPTFLSVLVPGRPVRALTCSQISEDDNFVGLPLIGEDSIKFIRQSSVEIRMLKVPVHLFLVPAFNELRGQVKDLHLRFSHFNYPPRVPRSTGDFEKVIEELLDGRSQWTYTQQLVLEFGSEQWQLESSWHLPMQHKALLKLLTRFPNAIIIAFTEFIQWHKNSKGVWNPHIPLTFRQPAFRHLKTGRFQSHDYEGCFLALESSIHDL